MAESERNWRRYVKSGWRKRGGVSLAEAAGITAEEIEAKLAEELGLVVSEAGRPDYEAMARELGLTMELLRPDSDSEQLRIYRGRKKGGRPAARIPGLDVVEGDIGRFGDHDRYGADEG